MIWQYIGGAAVTGGFTLLVLLLNRWFTKKDCRTAKNDDKEKRIEALENCIALLQASLGKSERDNCRIQMLIMMTHYPHETSQIMKLAQHYFGDLHGDWYMTGVFNKWLVDNNIGKPEWFNPES